jgi:predicted SAM-dependent methyltransferase
MCNTIDYVDILCTIKTPVIASQKDTLISTAICLIFLEPLGYLYISVPQRIFDFFVWKLYRKTSNKREKVNVIPAQAVLQNVPMIRRCSDHTTSAPSCFKDIPK